MTQPTVILRACPRYDPEAIRRITREAIDELHLRPQGRGLVKPNAVAAGDLFPHAYTRPEFLEGVLRGIRDRDAGLTDLALGERCGITMPTRYAFQHAGYYPMLDRVGVRPIHFDEVPQVEVPLYHRDRLRDSIFTPAPVAAADFFVNCPKFKAHPWTTVTFSLKSYIGIQDDRHRLIDHDHALNAKVRDLQYVVQPQLIAIDAITAGEGRMLTPLPFDLGLVILGNNQVAFDAVCCQIIGLDPMEVEHIRLAHEDGFGPVRLDEIRLSGDVALEDAQRRAEGFRTGLIRVEDYFAGTNLRAYSGPPPGDTHDYCWGGCPGAMEEAIEVLRVFDESTDERMPPIHLVFGDYRGEIDAKPGEKVLFIGDCARFDGRIAGQHVSIDSLYVDRSQKSVYEASQDDIFRKMLKVRGEMGRARHDDVMRLAGCPVSVAEQVLALVYLGKLPNPYLDPRHALSFVSCYLSSKTRNALQRVLRVPSDAPGPALRGAARPVQSLPPPGAEGPLEARRTRGLPGGGGGRASSSSSSSSSPPSTPR
jgi:uncharacterized protein (DUF362 family)